MNIMTRFARRRAWCRSTSVAIAATDSTSTRRCWRAWAAAWWTTATAAVGRTRKLPGGAAPFRSTRPSSLASRRSTEMGDATRFRLVLEVAVPDFHVGQEDIDSINEYADGDTMFVVTEEWMRRHVGLTLVSIPGEKNLNSDFEVHARVGEIVGARIEAVESRG